jgi:hypothetical protein
MTILLYLLPLLLVQQPNRPEFGTLSGQLRDSDGRPAAGIRVFVTPVEAAIAPRGGAPAPVRAPAPVGRSGRGGGTAILSSISQTDDQGRYQLTDVMPGRYFIAAGSLASPTYYPSGSTSSQGRIVNVVAGATIANLDITLAATTSSNRQRDLWGRMAFEDGSELQVGTLRQFAFILTSDKVQHIAQPFTVQQGLFAFQSIDPGEYVVSVAPLRLGYYLKSMTFGNVDLTRNPLTFGADGANTQIQVFLTKTRPAGTPPGVRVKGRIIGWSPGGTELELNAVSTTVVNRGHSEDLFSVASVTPRDDGSFELEGVPPGQYVISRYGSDRSTAFDVAGNDVSNLEVELNGNNRGTAVALNRNAIRSIRGTVEVDGGAIPEFIVTVTTVRTGAAATQTVAVSSKEFSIQLPEGEYRVSISGLARGYSIESVTAGPLDLTEPFLVTKSGIADRFTGVPVALRSTATAPAASAAITVRLRTSSSER